MENLVAPPTVSESVQGWSDMRYKLDASTFVSIHMMFSYQGSEGDEQCPALCTLYWFRQRHGGHIQSAYSLFHITCPLCR